MGYQQSRNEELPEWLALTNEEQSKWGALTADLELRNVLRRGTDTHDLTGMIREAFVLLERRIRESAGLEEHLHGKDLIDKAFHTDKGILQPVSPDGGERAGLYNLLLGIFLYYRNPIAHRPVYHTEESAFRVVSLIDHALHLVGQAVQASLNTDDFVGRHEGQVVGRRDFRVDVDGDGELEIVILLQLGSITVDGTLTPHLMPIVLKKEEKGYRRIPTEGVPGVSMYGPLTVKLHHVTNTERPDIVASWTWGENQTLLLILRYQEDRYVLAEREITPEIRTPLSAPRRKGFLTHLRQELDLVDVDGDRIDELVETLSFDPGDMKAMGYPDQTNAPGEQLVVCRLLKWDTEKERIAAVSEQVVSLKYS